MAEKDVSQQTTQNVRDDIKKKREIQKKTATVIDALRQKYCTHHDIQTSGVEIVFFAKPKADDSAELGYLRNVCLSEHGIHKSGVDSHGIRLLCPNIVDLDLTGNFIESWAEILLVVSQLDSLKFLNLARNKISKDKDVLEEYAGKLPGVDNLVLNSTGVTWDVVLKLARLFETLRELHICGNEYCTLPVTGFDGFESIECLRLNNNRIHSWEEIWKLRNLPNLKSLFLSGNPLTDIFYLDDVLEVKDNKQKVKGHVMSVVRHVKNTDMPVTENTDVQITENKDESITENTDLQITEHTDEPITKNTDIPITEHTDIPITENSASQVTECTDVPITEKLDVANTGNTDMEITEHTDVPIKETKVVSLTEKLDVANTENTDIPITEDTNVPIAESTDVPVTEDNDESLTESTHMSITEDTDVPITEITDVPITESTDVQITENTDVQITEKTDGPITETSDPNSEVEVQCFTEVTTDNFGRENTLTNNTPAMQTVVDPSVANDLREANAQKLKGSKSQITSPFPNLDLLCVSDTHIQKWKHLDAIRLFPELKALRITNIKLGASLSLDDRRKLFIACLPSIKHLNGSEVTATEREKAERHLLRYFSQKKNRPNVYQSLEQKHGKLEPLVDIDISKGYQEYVTLTFHESSKVVFTETVCVREPIGKLKNLIARKVNKNFGYGMLLYHHYTSPHHQQVDDPFEQLPCGSLPISRFDILNGDEIHFEFVVSNENHIVDSSRKLRPNFR